MQRPSISLPPQPRISLTTLSFSTKTKQKFLVVYITFPDTLPKAWKPLFITLFLLGVEITTQISYDETFIKAVSAPSSQLYLVLICGIY